MHPLRACIGNVADLRLPWAAAADELRLRLQEWLIRWDDVTIRAIRLEHQVEVAAMSPDPPADKG